MSKVLVEALGTFFVVLVIGMTVVAPGAGPLAPLAIGTMLMVMVYAGGPVSGAHYNPAVTLAVWLRGRCDTKDVGPYIGAQLVGATLASLMVGVFKSGPTVPTAQLQPLPVFLAELVFTFVLAYVVLHVSTVKKTAGNSYFGLAIGGTVMAAAYAAGPVSGGAFNPAVALGATIMGLVAPAHLWIFVIANLTAGVLAAIVFKATTPDR